MTATYDLDQLLDRVLRDGEPREVPPMLADRAIAATVGVRQSPVRSRLLDGRVWPRRIIAWPGGDQGRRVALIGLAALVILASVLTVVGASKLLQRPQTVFGSFERVAPLPPALDGDDRYINAIATLPDGRILTLGMFASGGAGWAYRYDPATNAWSAVAGYPGIRRLGTATTLPDGRVLVVGGWTADDEGTVLIPGAVLYDPATDTFHPTAGQLVTPRLDHTATLLADGRVLITGGQGQDFNAAVPELASAEMFDPATETFQSVGDMTVERQAHTATRLPDGRVLIAGGLTSRHVLATTAAEVFDPATNRFMVTGSMADPRSNQAAAPLPDGRVLVVGGDTVADAAAELTRPIATAELYDPGTGTFTSTGSLVTERRAPSATALADGRVLVAGGSNDAGAPRSAEVYDPADGRFHAAGSAATPHGDAVGAMLPDGRVLILGSVDDPAQVGDAEAWAPGTTDVTSVADRAGPAFSAFKIDGDALRTRHSATLLADGRVLVAGGIDAADPEYKYLASAVIVDPATGRTESVGAMTKPRSGHGAALLPDGRVLIVGGDGMGCPAAGGRCDPPPETAELFDPATGRFTALPVELGTGKESLSQTGIAVVPLDDGTVFAVVMSAEPSSLGGRSAFRIDPIAGLASRTAGVGCVSGIAPVRLRDGRIFIQCGGRDSGAYVYDATGRTVRTLSTEEGWGAAAGLPDGRVLVARDGGEAAIVDVDTGTYRRVSSGSTTSTPWHGPFDERLITLDDGRVLRTGGTARRGLLDALDIADVFDPATETFTSVGPMHAARTGHTATVLADGRVLLVGGVQRSPDRIDPLPTYAEIFDPEVIR